MQVCILAKNENIEVVREKARQKIEKFANHYQILGIGLSETGEKPITHWFCTFDASQEMIDKLKSIQEFTEIEVTNPRSFLKKFKLSLIKG
jgi:hypothetical protein